MLDCCAAREDVGDVDDQGLMGPLTLPLVIKMFYDVEVVLAKMEV